MDHIRARFTKAHKRRSSTCIAVAALGAVTALPLAPPLTAPARAQLFGGGGASAEKIVVKAQNGLKLGSRLAAVGRFAEALKVYQAAAAELQTARDADDKVSSERAGVDNDGPSGEEIADELAKRIAEAKEVAGPPAMSPEEAVHEVWERYETVKLNFGDGNNASPAEWEELARFLRVGIARLEGAFARQGNLKAAVIPNQGRVETKGAALLADFQSAFAQADKQAQKSRPKTLSADAPIATGAEPTISQRNRMRDLLAQAPGPGTFTGAGTEARTAASYEERAREAEALLEAYPALRDEPIQGAGPEHPNAKGSDLPGIYRAGIKATQNQVKRIAGEDAQRKADGIQMQLKIETDVLDGMTAAMDKDGFVSWGAADGIFAASYLAGRRAGWQKSYREQMGQAMPALFFQPFEAKLARLKAAIDRKAPAWSWPGGSHNATMEAKAKGFVASRYHARVIKTAMAEEGWRIQKNDIDIPIWRARSVRVLAQFPGEKWARQFNVAYVQDYAGGGSYNSGAYIGEPIDCRWMKAQ